MKSLDELDKPLTKLLDKLTGLDRTVTDRDTIAGLQKYLAVEDGVQAIKQLLKDFGYGNA